MSGMMGLHIGVRALQAQQRALDVTGHNIANANTEGYSRQRAEMAATLPYTMPSLLDRKQAGQVGTGVEVIQILRLREEFVDDRIRATSAHVGNWTQKASTMSEIEAIFNEPSEDSLRMALDKFWGALQVLHTDAADGGARSNVRESAASLTDVFRSLHTQLEDYRTALDGSVKNKVTEINTIAQQIADLNEIISQVDGKGENANDLMDQRDLLIDKLAKIVDINVTIDSRERANITINGFALIAGIEYSELTYEPDSRKEGLLKVKWKSTNNPLQLKSGELAGILDARDNTVREYMDTLDDMARNLVNEFNRVHQSGVSLNNRTGIKFFEGSNAADIRLSLDILDEVDGVSNIAAALSLDSPSDGRNALNLSNIMKTGLLNGNQTNLNDYWNGVITKVGIESQRASRLQDSYTSVQSQLEQQRSSVSGVSLDEEMGNLIMYQHAYNAAAKLITTQSEMLDTLVGIVK